MYSIIGSIGGVYVVREEKIGISSSVAIFRANNEIIMPQYMAYFLKSPAFDAQVQAIRGGVAQGFLSLSKLGMIDIFFPENVDYQSKIVNVLSKYDDLIENNQKQIKLLEEAAQRLYKEWFVDLRFPGYEKCQIVDGVPEGWEKSCLGDFAPFKRGKTITKAQVKSGSVPVVAGGLEPAYFHNESNTTAPVITVSGSGANAGFARLYNVDVFASDCSFIDSKASPYIYFIYCYIKENKATLDSLQKGAAQPHVYAKDINALRIIVPNADILKRFCLSVSLYFKTIKALQEQNEILSEARNRLLPKLMNGEIEV